MSKYLTVNFFSSPVVHNNARGESDGNLVKLQTIILNDTARTIISGECLRYAIREELSALLGETRMFRHSNTTEANSGYGYGPENDISLNKALAKYKDELDKYVDVKLFGTMCAETKNIVKKRSNILVSRAISMTNFEGVTIFTQGINGENGAMAPYNQQIHGTRYQYHITFDVEAVEKELIEALLKVCFAGLRVGGNHARNDMNLIPEMAVWRFYNTPGGSGLYAPHITCGDKLDISEYINILENRCVDFNIAGDGKIKIGQAADKIISEI